MKNKVEEHSSELFEKIFSEISELEQKKIENKMMIAAKIEDLLKSNDWSKKKFLEKLGMKNQSIISKWLSGTHNFTVDTLTEIEHILQTKMFNLEDSKEDIKYIFHVSVKSSVSIENSHNFNMSHSDLSKILGVNHKIKSSLCQA